MRTSVMIVQDFLKGCTSFQVLLIRTESSLTTPGMLFAHELDQRPQLIDRAIQTMKLGKNKLYFSF